MDRIPFGIRRLDDTLGGGPPAGSVVLLAGEPGAGAREFLHTSALMNGLARADEELFDLHYGSVPSTVTFPEEVHYLSLTSEERQVRREMRHTLEAELVDASIDAATFHDLGPEYFRLGPAPREWYADRTTSVADLGAQNRTGVLNALGDCLTEHAPGNLVVIDSLTDLVGALGEEYDWSDLSMLVRGLARAVGDWEGLILLHSNRQALSDRQHGQLVDASDGTLLFEWERGGSSLARTMMVQQFRGVLSRLEKENIVRFETTIGDTGFDVSDVRKIR